MLPEINAACYVSTFARDYEAPPFQGSSSLGNFHHSNQCIIDMSSDRKNSEFGRIFLFSCKTTAWKYLY
jgi:hypothetical protein